MKIKDFIIAIDSEDFNLMIRNYVQDKVQVDLSKYSLEIYVDGTTIKATFKLMEE